MRKNATDRERGAVVERVEHPVTKRTAEIRLNKRTMEFSCKIGDLFFADDNGSKVKDWALGTLKKRELTLLNWKPVIQCSVSDGDRYGYGRNRDDANDTRETGVKVKASRFWVALASKDADGKEVWRSIPWNVNDEDGGAKMKAEDLFGVSRVYREPRESYRYDRTSTKEQKGWLRLPEIEHGEYLLEYTPELWAGLQHIIDVVEREAAVLDRLLNTKQGRESLVQIGLGKQQLQLTSGAPVPTPVSDQG